MSSLDRPLLAIVSDLAGDRDHARTRQFADLLANQSHPQQITELVALLGIRDKAIQRAAAHLVGEVSDHNPNLFLPHLDTLVACVRSGSGPVVWESLHVLVQVAVANPRAVEPYLETFIAAIDGPLIVARDHAVRILARLASIEEIRSRVLAALHHALETAPINQLPMYAEEVGATVRSDESEKVRAILVVRLAEVVQPAKIRRLEAVLRRLPEPA